MRRIVLGVLSLASLGLCAASPLLLLLGKISDSGYKRLFLAGSAAYFVLATAWSWRRKKSRLGG